MSLVAIGKALLTQIRDRESTMSRNSVSHEPRPDNAPLAVSRSDKLEKFFGASPPKPKKVDPLAHLIQEQKFDRSLVFSMEGHVKGGTISKLVSYLTHHLHDDSAYTFAFLVTMPSFVEFSSLLRMLIDRYRVSVPSNLAGEERDYYIRKKVEPIRVKVGQVLLHWVSLWPETRKDESLSTPLRAFANNTLMVDYPDVAVRIVDVLDGTVDPYRAQLAEDKPPKPLIPKSLKGEISLFMLDPLEAARQLYLIDFAYYSAIRPGEFIKLAWSRKDDVTRAPSVLQVIRRSTQLTSFVCHTILELRDMKSRSEMVRIWILIMDKCRQLKNFNTLMAITGGLMSSSIHRLQSTWRLVPRKEVLLFEEIKELMSYRRNFGNYRDVLRGLAPPALPFLGIYLTDLTFIEEGNKDTLPNSELINFDKRSKSANVVKSILQFQTVKFNFEVVSEIEYFFQNIAVFERNEEEFYQLSLQVERKETESEVITRALAESGFI